MAICNAILNNGGIPTKSIISQLILTIDYETWYQIKEQIHAFYLMVSDANYLICIFMNTNENFKNEGKILKNINKLISATNHHQTNIVEYFISSVIQFVKSIHPMALYENYLICIFMNINENLKNEGKTIELKNEGVPTTILISHQQLNLHH